jgi:hypothetical protein
MKVKRLYERGTLFTGRQHETGRIVVAMRRCLHLVPVNTLILVGDCDDWSCCLMSWCAILHGFQGQARVVGLTSKPRLASAHLNGLLYSGPSELIASTSLYSRIMWR